MSSSSKQAVPKAPSANPLTALEVGAVSARYISLGEYARFSCCIGSDVYVCFGLVNHYFAIFNLDTKKNEIDSPPVTTPSAAAAHALNRDVAARALVVGGESPSLPIHIPLTQHISARTYYNQDYPYAHRISRIVIEEDTSLDRPKKEHEFIESNHWSMPQYHYSSSLYNNTLVLINHTDAQFFTLSVTSNGEEKQQLITLDDSRSHLGSIECLCIVVNPINRALFMEILTSRDDNRLEIDHVMIVVDGSGYYILDRLNPASYTHHTSSLEGDMAVDAKGRIVYRQPKWQTDSEGKLKKVQHLVVAEAPAPQEIKYFNANVAGALKNNTHLLNAKLACIDGLIDFIAEYAKYNISLWPVGVSNVSIFKPAVKKPNKKMIKLGNHLAPTSNKNSLCF